MNSKNELKPGQGEIREVNGEKVAAYKTKEGKVIKLSPVCTHMGCIVDWNENEETWDCPCHGSRFEPEGEVLQGPADQDLKEK